MRTLAIITILITGCNTHQAETNKSDMEVNFKTERDFQVFADSTETLTEYNLSHQSSGTN